MACGQFSVRIILAHRVRPTQRAHRTHFVGWCGAARHICFAQCRLVGPQHSRAGTGDGRIGLLPRPVRAAKRSRFCARAFFCIMSIVHTRQRVPFDTASPVRAALRSGDPTRKTVEQYADVVAQINALEAESEGLSDEALRAKGEKL
jgi:hypothetical protein